MVDIYDNDPENAPVRGNGIAEMRKALSCLKKYMETKAVLDRYCGTTKRSDVKAKAEVAVLDQELWKSALKPHNEEWIVKHVLLNEYFNHSFVCISYICNKSGKYMTLDTIKNVLFIGSGVFSFDAWNEPFVNAIANSFVQQNESLVNDVISPLLSNPNISQACKDTIRRMITSGRENLKSKKMGYINELKRYERSLKYYRELEAKINKALDNIKEYFDKNELKGDCAFNDTSEALEYYNKYFIGFKKEVTEGVVDMEKATPKYGYKYNANMRLNNAFDSIIDSLSHKSLGAFKKSFISISSKLKTMRYNNESELRKTIEEKIPLAQAKLEQCKENNFMIKVEEIFDWSIMDKKNIIKALKLENEFKAKESN